MRSEKKNDTTVYLNGKDIEKAVQDAAMDYLKPLKISLRLSPIFYRDENECLHAKVIFIHLNKLDTTLEEMEKEDRKKKEEEKEASLVCCRTVDWRVTTGPDCGVLLSDSAIQYVCIDESDGTMRVKAGDHETQVNFCPFCGRKADKTAQPIIREN